MSDILKLIKNKVSQLEKEAAGPPPTVLHSDKPIMNDGKSDWRKAVQNIDWRNVKEQTKDTLPKSIAVGVPEVKLMQQSIVNFMTQVFSGADDNALGLNTEEKKSQIILNNYLKLNTQNLTDKLIGIKSNFTKQQDVNGLWDQNTDTNLRVIYNAMLTLLDIQNMLNIKTINTTSYLKNFKALISGYSLDNFTVEEQKKRANALSELINNGRKLYNEIRRFVASNKELNNMMSGQTTINSGILRSPITEKDKDVLYSGVSVILNNEKIVIPFSALESKQNYLEYMKDKNYSEEQALQMFSTIKQQILNLPS